eukprot:JZ548140.1.p1 GENE.JZ548140.1~~JZ548140.1.p1  ORF type:complete len:192 (+),score=58.60 JZ548140.1:3-578(+)
MGGSRRNFSTTAKAPRRPYEKERMNEEIKLCGEYGLKNKREIWRTKLALAKIRHSARDLLTRDAKDPVRIFQGNALIRRLVRLGVLDEEKRDLDHVLFLKVNDLLERRLQTLVLKQGRARSIHHARVLIRQRHIRVGKEMVDVPSFAVRTESAKHIEFALTSPYSGPGAKAGRVKRRNDKRRAAASSEATE